LSYAERQHIYFHFILPAFLATAATIFLKRRNTLVRAAGVALVATLIVLTNFTIHFAIDTYLRRARSVLDPYWREIGLPSGRTALYHADDIAFIDTVHRYADSHFGPY